MQLEKLSKELIKEVSKSKNISTFKVSDASGTGRITSYEVIPGILLMFNDFQMESCVSNFYHYPDMLCIDHCLNGRIDMKLANGKYCYMEANDIRVGVLNTHAPEVLFPLKHYQGLTISIAIDEASKNIAKLDPEFPIDLSKLFAKIKKYEAFYVDQLLNKIRFDFSNFYSISYLKKDYYYRLKIFELLIYLDTIDIPAHSLANNYIYHSQIQKIEAIATFLKENKHKHYLLKNLAEHFDMSVSTMKKNFKNVYGKPIYTYTKEYKMNAVAVELCYSDESIGTLAARYGYDNASKFSAAFKSVIGIPPSDYRKKYKNQTSFP